MDQFLDFPLVSSVFMLEFMSALCSPDCHSFPVCFVIRYCDASSFDLFAQEWAALGHQCFHTNFLIIFIISVQKGIDILLATALNLQNCLCRVDILTILVPLIHKYQVFFQFQGCVCVCVFYNCFLQCFIILQYISFPCLNLFPPIFVAIT